MHKMHLSVVFQLTVLIKWEYENVQIKSKIVVSRCWWSSWVWRNVNGWRVEMGEGCRGV